MRIKHNNRILVLMEEQNLITLYVKVVDCSGSNSSAFYKHLG